MSCRVSPGVYKFVLLATIWHRQALQSFVSDIQICPSGHCCLSGHYSASRCPAELLQGYTNLSFWPLFGIARPCRVSPGIYKFVLLATIWHRQALQSFCSDIQICPSGHCCLSGHYSPSRCPAEFLQGYTNLSFWPLFGIARPCRVSPGIYKFVLLATVWHRQALQFLQVYTNLSFWPLFGIARPCRVSPGIYKFVPLATVVSQATIRDHYVLQSFCRDIQICPSGHCLASPGPAVSPGIYKFVLLATIWHRQALQSFPRDIQICPSSHCCLSGHYSGSLCPAEFLQGYTNLSFWPLFGIARPCSFSRDIQICPSGHYLASPGPAEFLQGYTNLFFWPLFGLARPCRVSAGIYKFVLLAIVWHRQALQFLQVYTNLSFWPLFGIARPCRVSPGIYKFVPLATVVSKATIRHHDVLQSFSRVIQICPSGHYLASPGPAVSPGIYKFVLLATIWHRQALQSFSRDIQICPSGHYLASPGPAEFLQGYTNLSFWPLFGIATQALQSFPGIYKFVLLATIWHRQALQSFCRDIQICPSGHCCLSGHYSASLCPAEFLQGYTNLSFWPLFGIARPSRVSPGIYKFVLLATIWHRQALQSFSRDMQICPSGHYLASPGPAEFLQGYTNLSFWPLFGIGGSTGLVVRVSDSGSGDPGSILGRVGVLFP